MMCSSVPLADLFLLDSASSEGLTPPPSPYPTHSNQHPSSRNAHSPPPFEKRVRFQETRSEIFIESLTGLSDSDKDKLWFTATDIEGFKATARALCDDIKSGNVRPDDGADSTRGLELRMCQERQRRKFLILQAILRAQKRFKDPKQLSNIARKCSIWSKAVAAIWGQRDYYDLYDPGSIPTLAELPAIEDYPLPFKNKMPVTIPMKRPISPVPRVRSRPAPFAAPC